MEKPENEAGKSWFGLALNPPDAVAGVCLLLAVTQLFQALSPRRLTFALWRAYELSPARAMRAAEEGHVLAVAKALLGHMIFHVNALHLVINLAAIVVFGSFLHQEMALRAGDRGRDVSSAFLAFLIASGLAAGAAFVIFSRPFSPPMIGASGAAAGLLGGAVWVIVTRMFGREETRSLLRNIVLLAGVSAVMISLSIFLDTSKLSRFFFGSVSAWQAHIGGYVFGLAAYPLFERMAGGGR